MTGFFEVKNLEFAFIREKKINKKELFPNFLRKKAFQAFSSSHDPFSTPALQMLISYALPSSKLPQDGSLRQPTLNLI
jgi:hypothetical protein